MEDPLIKIKLTEQLSTLLIGAYRESEKSCKQYLEQTLNEKQIKNKEEIIEIFTEKFLSHGYPMNRKFLTQNNIAVAEHEEELETKIYDMYEKYVEMYEIIDSNNPSKAGRLLLIQTRDRQLIKLGHEIISNT